MIIPVSSIKCHCFHPMILLCTSGAFMGLRSLSCSLYSSIKFLRITTLIDRMSNTKSVFLYFHTVEYFLFGYRVPGSCLHFFIATLCTIQLCLSFSFKYFSMDMNSLILFCSILFFLYERVRTEP